MRKTIFILIMLIVSTFAWADTVEHNGVSISFELPGVTITSKDIETYERSHHIPSYVKDQSIINRIRKSQTVKILKVKGTCHNGKFVVKGTATRPPLPEGILGPGRENMDVWLLSCTIASKEKITPKGDEAVDYIPGELDNAFWRNFKKETLTYNFEVPGNAEVSNKHKTIQFRIKLLDGMGWVYVFGEIENLDAGALNVTEKVTGSDVVTVDKGKMENRSGEGEVDSNGLSWWEIPSAVAVVVFLTSSGAAVLNNEDEEGDGEEGDEEVPEEEPVFGWRFMKEFGDMVVAGDIPRTIAAKLVQYKDGMDVPLDHMTQLIQITSPDNFIVTNQRMLNGYMAADIHVNPQLTIEQMDKGGYVNFTIAGNGASHTCSMYFEIDIPSYEMEDLKVILGDGMVYQTDIQLHSGAFPKDVRVTSHPDYEVVEQPVPKDTDDRDLGKYTLQILNKSKKPATNVLQGKNLKYYPVEVNVEAEFENGLIIPGTIKVYEFPDGMYFVADVLTDGYANIRTDNARETIIFGMKTVIRTSTEINPSFARYDADKMRAFTYEVKDLKENGKIKGEGEYEEGLSRNFEFKIEPTAQGYGLTPQTTLGMESEDKPYIAELPVKGVVEADDFSDVVEGNLMMALYGLVPYKRTSWDDECDRLLKMVTLYELQGDKNVQRMWEYRKHYSANEINLYCRALIKESMQYHSMLSNDYKTQAEWLSCGLVCCQVLQYVGDQASEIVLTYYLKSFGKWVANPLRKLIVTLAAEITARYIDGQPLIVNDDYEAMGNTLFEIFNTALSDEIDKWVENPKDWKQAGFLIAAFVGVNTLKHYYLDDDKSNRGDFWLAVCLSCTDMFKESVRATVGKMFGNWLGKIGVNGKKKLSEWLGSSMSADEKLRELVMGKLDDLFGKNQASNAFSTLWDNFPDINENLKSGKNFDYGDFFFKLLVPDKDDDAKLADFVEVAQIVLTVLTYPFEKRINTNVVANTDVRICRERGENETAQSRLEAIQHPY